MSAAHCVSADPIVVSGAVRVCLAYGVEDDLVSRNNFRSPKVLRSFKLIQANRCNWFSGLARD